MKKNKTDIIKDTTQVENNEYRNLIILIVVIALVFTAFYVLTLKFTKENHDNIFKNDLDASEIGYDEIIIGSMFDLKGTYYILLIEENDVYKDIFNNYVTSVKENHKIYTVDLSSAFNKRYLADEYSYSKDNFKTKGTLLLKISDGEIKAHYTEKTDITNKLAELSKD